MRPVLSILLAAVAMPALAAEPRPEIERTAVTPQAVGAAHTLRQIPEACVRIEGVFTGDPAEPYRYAVVRSSPNCQPRARFVDAAKVRPAESEGWIFNDLLRIPNAACLSQQAVVRIWRKPVDQAVERDGQGQLRVYAADAKQAGAVAKAATVPVYAAEMGVEGEACD